MRILFLSTWFPYPPDNGSKVRVYHLSRALAQRHEVTLLSFAFDTARPDEADKASTGWRQARVVPRDPFQRSRLARWLRFFSPGPIVAAPIKEMSQLVQQAMTETAFDVVIASTVTMATYALQVRETRKILEEHNSGSRMMWERYREQRSAGQRLRCWASWQKTRLYEARLFRRFDLCTMASEQDRQASLQMLPGYAGPVAVVANGVDCQHNRPGLAQPVPDALVFNGALTYGANYDAMRYFLAEVYPLIQKKAPGISLTITGSTSGVELSALRRDDSVHLSGYVRDIRPLVAGASVCVAPIRWGGGSRLKILEAMALGTPVVSTFKGAEGLDTVDGEHILLADDPMAFADCTLRLLHDAALRQRLSANARALVEQRYDWTQIGCRFVELVEDTAKPGGSP